MRGLGLLVLLWAATASAKPSNPTFLGIGMQDVGRNGPCQVTLVTPDSGAPEAHLLRGDLMVTIDGKPVETCDAVLKSIIAHDAGDWVAVGVIRGATRVVVKAQVLTRDEVLRRRLVGRSIATRGLETLDDGASVDLGAGGKTTIVGWFDPTSCDGCAGLLARVSRWTREHTRKRGAAIETIGASLANQRTSPQKAIDDLRAVQKQLDVPLLVADESTYRDFTIDGTDRMNFVVIDCRGVVQHVSSLVPTADDADAILDDLYAATEQAARHLQ